MPGQGTLTGAEIGGAPRLSIRDAPLTIVRTLLM